MFVVKTAGTAKRLSRVMHYPYIIGFGTMECSILMKLLNGEDLLPQEEEGADKMQETLTRLKFVMGVNTDEADGEEQGMPECTEEAA